MNKLEIINVKDINSTVEKIKSGELSVTELVKTHIDLAKEINPHINAFITILEDEALKKAQEIDLQIANKSIDFEKYKLLGIPFTTKDLYLKKGIRTTFGSQYMKDFIAPYSSFVLEKCEEQGAILIAKCNCDPWGFGGSGENSGFGPIKHPLDFERTPGGSSSGSAASMLAGVGFFSLGTDTGGSVRQPASMCGLYGMKPTYGRNSRYGIGAMGSSFDTPGFFTRNIQDTILLEKIMEGRNERDDSTYDLTKIIKKERKDKIRVGVPKEYFEVEGLNSEVKDTVLENINKLKDTDNVEIVEISLPSSKYALGVYYILIPSEISSNRARYDGVRFGPYESEEYETNMIQGRSKYLENEVKRRIMIGTYCLSAGYADQYYKQASKVRTKLKGEFENAFKEVDIILSPVAPTTAYKIGEKINDPIQMYLEDIYTVTANIVGIPSISVPIGNDSKGLPVGIQVMTEKFQDDFLLEFVKKYMC